MVNKNKMAWKKSTSLDFDQLEKQLKQLSRTGLYSGGNVFFGNDVLAYVASLPSTSSIDYAKRNIVLDLLYNARKYAPGTELLLADMISSESQYEDVSICRTSSDEAVNLTKQFIKSQNVKHIFDAVTKLMGTTGRIHVTEEPIANTEINLSNGCEIDIHAEKRFTSQTNIKNIKFDFIKVCIIEGAPTSVAEINKLLMHCYKNKTVLLLLARSFPQEVINTLAVNWNNKKLRIIPYIYGNEVFNINSHADLASVSGAVPISSMKGDTLQGDLSEKFGELLNFINKDYKITAIPTSSPKNLINSLSLKLKKIDFANHDKIQIISKRIAGLSEKTLYVKIAKSQESWRIKNELDIAISLYNGYCQKLICVKRNNEKFKFPYNIYKKAIELQNTYRETKQKIGGYVVYSDKKNMVNCL